MGAEYFYSFFGPGVSQWHPPLWENTTPLEAPRTPEEGYHLEADMADRTIARIDREKSLQPDKPWIAYYAPNGHKPPVAVPSEWIEIPAQVRRRLRPTSFVTASSRGRRS